VIGAPSLNGSGKYDSEEAMSSSRRWGIAAAGFLMQVALGAVYAWSVFRIPLSTRFHWSIAQVTLTFTIAISV